jgi:DNA-directed RNA polymerase sigma subunit (sigma70/sigma32)
VSCRHHLYLEVNPDTGTIRVNYEGEVEDMRESCALDVAEQRFGITLEEIGALLGLTRERIRQVEVRGLLLLRKRKLGQGEY